jgi:hypothetical protein
MDTMNWRKSSYSGENGGNCVEAASGWRKSSYSGENGGNCVEASSDWRKSSYSADNGGQCVEAASSPARFVAVRDSKDPHGPVLAVAPAEWRNFIAAVKTGQHDLT